MKWLKNFLVKRKTKKLEEKVDFTTARGEQQIGRAFKTIFSRLHRPKVAEFLRMIGIESNSEDGKCRPSIQILHDLAKIFPNLSPKIQTSLTQQIAGLKNSTIFRALMKHV